MNLLFRVLFAHSCRSTHHKLALDALRHLGGDYAEKWRNVMLAHHAPYLEGAKAPDNVFKDFRNHVLHVGDDFWGGAPAAAVRWYGLTLDALRAGDWPAAAYNAGVTSHYFTDPFMPFHTGQSEAENNIHRAAEWSITKSYDTLVALLEARLGYPRVGVPIRDDWLEEMVKDGARHAHPSYDTLLRRYDFARGVKDPPAGLDDVCREHLARLLGLAAVGFARVLDMAFANAGVMPPAVSLTLPGFLATLNVPIKWVTNKLADAAERATVEAMYRELEATGKVERSLTDDVLAVREMHYSEVVASRQVPAPVILPMLKAAEPVAVIEPASEVGPTLKFFLRPEDPVADGPSVGPKTAKWLNALGVTTVADLLGRDAAELAAALKVRRVTARTVADWQDQARLMCAVPHVRGHDVQILVACGYRTPEAVASADVEKMLAAAETFASSVEGQRVLRGGKPPDRDEVDDWMKWAASTRRPEAKAA